MLRAVGSTDATVGGGKSRKSGRGAGNGKGPNGGGTNDPFFSSVVTLLHFDGTNGSTTFTDVKGKTYTASGSAQIRTANPKFGTGSGLFASATSDLVSTPNSADFEFGTDDFTVEAWIYATSFPGVGIICGQRDGTAGWEMVVGADQSFFIQGQGSFVQSAISAILPNQWIHVAVSRISGVTTIYVDGFCRSSGTLNTVASSLAFTIGARPGGTLGFNGNIDEIRVTKGVGRYTGTTVNTQYFTPPTAAFPDS